MRVPKPEIMPKMVETADARSKFAAHGYGA
jgi:hypothetical protein